MLATGGAALFSYVEDIAAGRRCSLGEHLEGLSDGDIHVFAGTLLNYAVSEFDGGSITCKQLLEFVVAPFLKLARKISQKLEPEGSADVSATRVRENLFFAYGGGITVWLEGLVIYDNGVPESRKLSLSKRTELVKTLMKNKFPEVRSIINAIMDGLA